MIAMKLATLLVLALFSCRVCAAEPQDPAPPRAGDALVARLHSAVARTVFEEYVADVVDAAAKQASAFTALDKDLSRLSAEQAREQLAFLERMALTRSQLSQSRRAVLACAQLTREESELLLNELARVKADWDKLLAEDVPARRAALARQIDIAAVAVMAPAATAEPAARSPAEILQAASRRLHATGIAFIGGEYQILLDGQRMRAGQTIKVKLDRDYTVVLASVAKGSFTLALDGETLVVPIE